MVKCSICKKKIEHTFLNKLLGTVVKDGRGKQFPVCQDCQRGKSKEELLSAIKG